MRLYLGLDCPKTGNWTHFPVIKIHPRSIQLDHELDTCTHLIFTSKSAVHILAPHLTKNLPLNKCVLSVGSKTSAALIETGIHPQWTATDERAEGILELLDALDLKHCHIFWPHSALSRPLITDYLRERNIPYSHCILYDTLLNHPGPLPSLDRVEEIAFTSPSTFDNFLTLCPQIPPHIKLTPIGSVTAEHIKNYAVKISRAEGRPSNQE